MPTNNSCDFANPVGVTNGGTGAATFAADGVLYGNTTSAIGATAVGTAGQVLTSNGAGNAPTFTDRGRWVKLSTATPSGAASVAFTSLISSTYKTYVLVFDDILTAAGSNMGLTLSSDNGVSYVTTNYASGNWYLSYNSATVSNQNFTTLFQLVTGAENTYGTSGTVWMYGLGVSSKPKIQGDFFVAEPYWQKTAGIQTATATYNAIKLAFDAGTIASGTITLYGLLQ